MKVRRIDFYPDEWLAGTAELQGLDRGVYITVCALIYSRGGAINEELLRRHCREHGNTLKASLTRLAKAGKIIRNGPEIGQKRSENELETVQKRLRKLSESGTKGNDIKKMRAATRSLNGHATTTTTTTTTKKNIDRAKALSPARRARSAEEEFSSIYALYPRHVGRGAALKAFIRARQTVELLTLQQAVERFAEQRVGEDPRYTPHMSTWLNAQRWADEDVNSNPQEDAAHDDAARQAALEEALRELERERTAAEIREAH
jgi:hypothetical protein